MRASWMPPPPPHQSQQCCGLYSSVCLLAYNLPLLYMNVHKQTLRVDLLLVLTMATPWTQHTLLLSRLQPEPCVHLKPCVLPVSTLNLMSLSSFSLFFPNDPGPESSWSHLKNRTSWFGLSVLIWQIQVPNVQSVLYQLEERVGVTLQIFF